MRAGAAPGRAVSAPVAALVDATGPATLAAPAAATAGSTSRRAALSVARAARALITSNSLDEVSQKIVESAKELMSHPDVRQLDTPRHTITVDAPLFRRRLLKELPADFVRGAATGGVADQPQ